MLKDINISILGPGVMGRAIVSCLINKGKVDPKNLVVGGPYIEENEAISAEFGVVSKLNNEEAIKNSDIVILAVKPQRLDQVSQSIKNKVGEKTLVISIIAGASLATLREKMGTNNIIRAMPNTASQIGMGITVWVKTEQVSDEMKEIASNIFLTMGEEVFEDDESYLDMATALSGTGPAYVFLFMEAMIDAGVHMGFPRKISEKLVVQTIRGSTEFYLKNHEHPARLRNEVTSPGGTSAEALYYLEKAGFRTAISRAIWAAYTRSIELGKGKSKQVVDEN
ncbi:MAG: pyrroline-5-carboxylate reductase [Chloroflexi bacterium]|nr:pyrroline-5-carboxylate reductase [Chloroflexota bacterium]